MLYRNYVNEKLTHVLNAQITELYIYIYYWVRAGYLLV